MKPQIKRKKPEPYVRLDAAQAGVAITFGTFACNTAPLHYEGEITMELRRKGVPDCDSDATLTAVLTQWPTIYFPFDQQAYSLPRGWYVGSLYQDCTDLQCNVTLQVGAGCRLTAQTQEKLCAPGPIRGLPNPNTKPRSDSKLFTGCQTEYCPCTPLDPCEGRELFTLVNCAGLDEHIAKLQAELEK